MERSLFLLVIISFCTASLYSQNKVRGRVINAQTGAPLPYASIYVSYDRGAITNEAGYFSLEVNSGDSLRVSSIGFHLQVLPADNIPNVIRLLPRELVLKEVTVIPVKNVLESVVKRLDRDFIKKP